MNQTLYIVVTGFVSLYKISSQGERKTIFLLGKGELVNEEVFQNMPASINCEAFEPSLVLCFGKMDFLADMLGSRRETVSRQLKNLTEQGLVRVQRGKIIIPDRDALSAFFKGINR